MPRANRLPGCVDTDEEPFFFGKPLAEGFDLPWEISITISTSKVRRGSP
jgi:hypothetical protein